MRPPRKTYRVPVTITDERLVTVKARSAEEAKERVKAGKYETLGRSIDRGFLLIGDAEESDG